MSLGKPGLGDTLACPSAVDVVTADRELTARVRGANAEVVGPSWLLDQLLDRPQAGRPERAASAVLTDFKMPVMNGLDALAEIRSVDPDAKVVMLSA